MSRMTLAGIGIVLLILDSALGGMLSLGSIRPSLTLPFVVYVGLTRGPIEGTLFGFAIGLGQDLFGALPLGATSLIYSAIGFTCGKLWVDSSFRLFWPWGIFLLVSSIADQAFSIYLAARATGLGFFSLFLGSGIPAAIYTTGIGLLWFVSPFHKVRPT
ncbi:MAG: hypothetical protein ACOZB3_12530 [Calditrichota bacterium]